MHRKLEIPREETVARTLAAELTLAFRKHRTDINGIFKDQAVLGIRGKIQQAVRDTTIKTAIFQRASETVWRQKKAA